MTGAGGNREKLVDAVKRGMTRRQALSLMAASGVTAATAGRLFTQAGEVVAIADALDWDTLDYLVLNAGAGHYRPIDAEDRSSISETLQINLVTPLQLVHGFAERLLAEGVYAIGFSFPVVPQGTARVRTQMSAAHTPEQIEQAIAAFAKVGRELGVIDS